MSFTQERRVWVSEESFSSLAEENTLKARMDSQRYPGGCQVVPIWNLVAMWPSEKEEEENVILISDDDDDEVQCPGDDGGGESTQESSVLFVEPQGKSCSLAAAAVP